MTALYGAIAVPHGFACATIDPIRSVIVAMSQPQEVIDFQQSICSKHAEVVVQALRALPPFLHSNIKVREAIDEALDFAVIGHLNDVVDVLAPLSTVHHNSASMKLAVRYKNIHAVQSLRDCTDLSAEKHQVLLFLLFHQIDDPVFGEMVDILFDKIDHEQLEAVLVKMKLWDRLNDTVPGRSYLQKWTALQDHDALMDHVGSVGGSSKPSKM